MQITTEFVGFLLLIMGALGGVWARIESIVNRARADAMLAANTAAARADAATMGLAELRLHVAQSYVSKEGLREQVGQVMDLLRDVQGDVAHINERMDRVIEGRPGRQGRGPPPRKMP